MSAEEKKPQVQGTWLKMFCPDARCLSEEEVAALPPSMTQAAGTEKKEGLWLEVFCPDQSCLTDAEKGAPAPEVKHDKDDKGTWLKIFCPDGSCEITGPDDIP